MPDAERLEELAEVSFQKSFLLPEPEQHTQCGHDVYLIGGMGKDEGHDMIFSNILLVADTLRFKMMQELAQVKTIVTDGGPAAAEVGQMLYQPLHILSQFTIQTMINGSETTLADMSGQQHVVKHLDAADLLPFLLTDGSVAMTSFNEHCAYACLVLPETPGLHEWGNAMSPECLVHANAISRVVVLLEEGDALSNQCLDFLFLHNN